MGYFNKPPKKILPGLGLAIVNGCATASLFHSLVANTMGTVGSGVIIGIVSGIRGRNIHQVTDLCIDIVNKTLEQKMQYFALHEEGKMPNLPQHIDTMQKNVLISKNSEMALW